MIEFQDALCLLLPIEIVIWRLEEPRAVEE